MPQQVPPGDIYPVPERGVIDAVECIGPCDDEKLGLNRVARNYHHPGWGEGGTVFHAFVNQAQWDAPLRPHKAAVEAASQAATPSMMAAYGARNPEALVRLAAAGAILRAFPDDAMDALRRASQELHSEIGASNAAFRDGNHQRYQVADFQFDAMTLRLRRRG